MMENTELIKVLRCEYYGDDECDKSGCPIWSELGCKNGIANRAAAAALEAAEKRIAELSLDNKMLKNTIDADKGVMLDRIRFLEAQLPKEGEWLDETDGRYFWHGKCSICNYEYNIDSYYADMNYCPNCGAKMKGENDGES